MLERGKNERGVIEGVFHKGAHKRRFAYEAHTACDKNGYVQ